jgi:hypothetical protein
MIQVADYKNVTISGNYLTANDGEPNYDYYDNTCNNAWDIWDSTNWQFPSYDYTDSGISDCGNSYWLTSPVNGAAADARSDRKCS